MKTISKQYQDLLEGKMSRGNFVRNCRQQFPQFISSVTSIDDAIKILKSKRIIGEMKDFRDTNAMNSDAMKQGYDDNYDGYGLEDCPYRGMEASLWKDGWMEAETEKQMDHDEETYNRETGGYGDLYKESLNEASEKPSGNWEKLTGKDEYGRFKDIDNVNYTTFLRAVAYECGKQQDMADDLLPAILEKVAKKMKKDPNAYRELVISNYAEIAKQDEALKMIPVNGKKQNDDNNAMEKIKGQEIPKSTPSKTENRKGKPEGVKEMGITPKKAKGITAVMDMPGKEKVLASLKESLKKSLKEDTHYKYNRGSKAVTPEGEGTVVEVMGGTVTVEFKDGQQRDYQVNTLDHFEKKANEDFRPGVDLGASFEKFKNSLAQEDEQERIEQELIKKLKSHDWYYQMSDDQRWWERGNDEATEIRSLMKKLPQDRAQELYNMYSPYNKNKSNVKEVKKDKYSKLKEFLKKALKEKLSTTVPKGANDAVKAAAIQKTIAKAKVPADTPIDVIEK